MSNLKKTARTRASFSKKRKRRPKLRKPRKREAGSSRINLRYSRSSTQNSSKRTQSSIL